MSTHVGRRRWPAALAIVLVVLLVGAGGAAYGLGWVDHWRGTDVPATPPTAALDLEPLRVADTTVAAVSGSGHPKQAVERAALALKVAAKPLGKHVVAAIAPAAGGAMSTFGTGRATPASITKIMTSTAALERLGPEHRFTTSVTRRGHTVTLVGGGDPLLASADLRDLARSSATKLAAAGVHRVRVAYDDSLFTGPSVATTWRAGYVPEEAVPVTALIVDEGHTAGTDGEVGTDDDGRVTQPSLAAAEVFARALAKAGVTVTGDPRHAASAGGATVLASHRGETVGMIVEHTLRYSDNQAAEMLGRQVGLKAGDASFTGGARAVTTTLVGLGIPAAGIHLFDSSGLSRQGKLSATAVADALRLATEGDHPELSSILAGLPVAGFEGSLEDRFVAGTSSSAGQGVVRAKTGTLTGVSGLAGVVTDANGTPFVVVVIADRITPAKTWQARLDEEDVLAAVASCDCS
ncbi:MAG: D-alanyl-D-alanine carboxypeptidase/D-alanyl-D-alanine-endopeptidase [Nocardioides sp.]|uniref:D-alanyl-D-alanine carboxypeptidase/D-alanyl-D-alanine endopeptidase n=1 Tax=Nocardioides sp. TaxID=35761 RepID=UPI0039E2D24D